MKSLVLMAAILIAQSVYGQEVKHAPTVDQCRADYRLWFSKLENPHGTDAVSQDVLSQWYSEMGDCTATDSEYEWHYVNAQAEICAERELRMQHFLKRHDLIQQYLAEDQAGAR